MQSGKLLRTQGLNRCAVVSRRSRVRVRARENAY